MKRALISLTLCLGIVILGAAVTIKARANRAAGTLTPSTVEERLTNVAVQVVKAQDVGDLLVLTGSIEPWEEVTLSAETSGKIELQRIEEGDRVRAGQEIIKINTRSIQASMARSEAELALAEQELARVEELNEEGISSPQQLDRALTDREAARAGFRLAEIQLGQSVISAPISGVVDTLYNEEGEFVTIGTDLVRILQIVKVKAVIGLPERDVALFEPGAPVTITLDSFAGRSFEGHIFRIATSAEVSTRTFATEIELDNAEGLLRPGMIVRAQFVRKTYEEAITVPLFCVMTRRNQRAVFVEKDGVAWMRPVEIGFFQGDLVHITQGLEDGDRLIVQGQRDLSDGQKVAVQPVPHAGA